MNRISSILLLIAVSLSACAPAGDLPAFETNKQTVIDALAGTSMVPSLDYLAGYDFADPPAECFEPCAHTWDAAFSSSTRVLIGPGWCATDKETLASDLQHSKISLTVDGKEIPPADVQRAAKTESFAPQPGSAAREMECAYTGAIAYNWPAGAHTVVVTLTFDQDISDGIKSYTKGSYVNTYKLKITP